MKYKYFLILIKYSKLLCEIWINNYKVEKDKFEFKFSIFLKNNILKWEEKRKKNKKNK